jgi:hypothetical protein
VCRFFALREGLLACKPSIARKPHHAREARASYRHLEYRGDYAEGLGRYPTGFLVAARRKGKEV